MKGDLSRRILDTNNNFCGVIHQQGRVLLDSDWNAQAGILNGWQEVAVADILGTGVAAVPARVPNAFKVVEAKVEDGKAMVFVEEGRAWADGLKVIRSNSGWVDAEYLAPPIQDPRADVGDIAKGMRDAVVLEVWQEALSGFQSKETLIEEALGGPDTTGRVLTSMRLKLFRLGIDDDCKSIIPKLKDDPAAKGRLKATLKKAVSVGGDCPVPEKGGYVGFEHALYRIEIAKTKEPKAMFKWSQFNGGLVGRGTFDAANNRIIVNANNVQAIKTSALDRAYLEVVEDFDAGKGFCRVLYGAKVTIREGGNVLEIGTELLAGDGLPADGDFFFRLWNGIDMVEAFPRSAGDEQKKELNDGIRLEFDTDNGKNYTPGDFWCFSVRAGEIANPDIFVDGPPQGIIYHRVPLAVVIWDANKTANFDDGEIHDCREIFRPLRNRGVCCTYTVGDGVSTHGDFDSIETAIKHLPPSGGTVCLLPGVHKANVTIENREGIRIRGCGKKTTVVPCIDKLAEPVFVIRDSRGIIIEDMDIVTYDGIAIAMVGTGPGKLVDIKALDNRIIAYEYGVAVWEGSAIEIRGNTISMLDKGMEGTGVCVLGEDILVERNCIGVIPAEAEPPPAAAPGGEPAPAPADRCADTKIAYSRSLVLSHAMKHWSFYANSTYLDMAFPTGASFKARGGLQVGGGSERVRVLENTICGGRGNGVTLGHLPSGIEKFFDNRYLINASSGGIVLRQLAEFFDPFLYDIEIEGNEILNMGLNGIGVVAFFDLHAVGQVVSVNGLSIYRNRIEGCMVQLSGHYEDVAGYKAGFGGVCLADCDDLSIRENRIENNGLSHLEPICGVFVQHGDRVDISDNTILNNGPRTEGNDKNARSGIRAGVVVFRAIKTFDWRRQKGGDRLPTDSVPAVRVHGNTVTQPLGQALLINAMGPLSIVGNYFCSQGIESRSRTLSRIAGAVLLTSLSFDHELVGGMMRSYGLAARSGEVMRYNAAVSGSVAESAGGVTTTGEGAVGGGGPRSAGNGWKGYDSGSFPVHVLRQGAFCQ